MTVRVMLRDICSKPPSFAPGLTFFGLALQGGDQMGLSYTDGSRFSIQYPFPPIIMDMKIKRGVSPRVATFQILRQVSTEP